MASETLAAAAAAGSPCGACKFLRRKCASDCVFAPYFCTEQGPARFAAIHKVFGASNVSKLLLHVPVHDRCEAVVTIAYEAQARLKDPVYGCVSHIFALQQQVTCLQAQLMQMKTQIAHSMVEATSMENEWGGNNGMASYASYNPTNCMNSIESMDYNNNGGLNMQEQEFSFQPCLNKKRLWNSDLGDLQSLAIRMMRN